MQITLLIGWLLLLSSSLRADLKEPGWNPRVKAKLNQLIQSQRGKALPVVFDFDNTLLCRDIGEATLGVMAKSGTLTVKNIPIGITPIAVQGQNIADIYEKLLDSTKHHSADKAPYLNAYAWTVQIMAGHTPQEIVDATAIAYGNGTPSSDVKKPYLYPEMVELVAELRKAGFDVWVISASNVWSVRWMVTSPLNALLQKRGVQNGIPADHVIGINTLLEGPDAKLYKDQFLTQENPSYGAGEFAELSKYRLSTQIVHPLSASYGKAAIILERIGKTPYLVAGDSPNDHGMLSMAKNKLWIARTDKPAYLQETKMLAAKTQPATWMYQSASTGQSHGFLKNHN